MDTHECKYCKQQVVLECFDTEECDNYKTSRLSVVARLVMRFRVWQYRRTWEMGICGPGNKTARRHRRKGNVQFVVWKAGEQGYTEDYWYDFDSSWWPGFTPYE